MSDEPDIIDADAPILGAQAVEPDEAPQDAPLSAEDRAMGMGWTPKAQFRGDPEKWVDAETFVKRGEEFLPFLKANNKRLEQALERAEKRAEKTEATLKEFAKHHEKTEARAYERAMADIQARLDAAAEAGDVQGVRDATDELVDLAKDAAPAKIPDADADPIFEAWKAENSWYGKDTAMTAAANAIGNELFNEGISGKAQGVEVTRRIKAEFPHKFTNPNRTGPAAVEGAGVAPRKAGKSYSDLPPDAKAACDEFVKKGLLTREKYAAEYFTK